MRSLMTRLKMSDQVSSPATWMPPRAPPASSARPVARPAASPAGRCPQISRNAVGDSETLRRGERIAGAILEAPFLQAGRLRGLGEQRRAIGHQRLVGLVRAIPFQQREFGMMQRAALAVAEHAGEGDDLRLARRQQLLAGELRRGVQMHPGARRRPAPSSSVANACRWVRCPARPGGSASRPRRNPGRANHSRSAAWMRRAPAGTAAGRRKRRGPTRGKGRSHGPHSGYLAAP